jgi:hypothetical protein
MRQFLIAIHLCVGVCGLATTAVADDWVAQKLRGVAYIWVNNHWDRLNRGDIVSNGAPVQTMKDGQVEFVRDQEIIDLGPDTQIQILDRTRRRYTTVNQAFGSVHVEANVENVQHFSVQTPFMAATVKGTIFTVVSGAKSAEVRVKRGKVSVDDLLHRLHVDVLAGQSAAAGRGKALSIAGAGKRALVLNAAGQSVAIADLLQRKRKNVGGSGNVTTNWSSNGNGNDDGTGNGKGNSNGDSTGKGNSNGDSTGNGKGSGNGNENEGGNGNVNDNSKAKP